MEPLQPGDPDRIGPYRVVARLGAGGMGRVYLARSRSGRPVAVKVVHSRYAGQARYRARFRREVDAARRVVGAFTAPVLDAGADAPTPWLATAYLPGPSLREAVAEFGPLPADAARALAAGLAEALAAIHRGGLVHRDLKPANVLLTAGGPRVIDFGIARPDDAAPLTRAGHPIGSPGFMSPEQVRGREIGPASDVFTLGATLAYAASGVEPFGTGPVHARHLRVMNVQADLGAITEPWLRDLVTACLRAEASTRPSAAEVLDRLGALGGPPLLGVGWLPAPVAAEVERRTAEVVPEAPPPAGPRRPGRRTVLAGIGAGVLAAAGTGVLLRDGTAGGPASGGSRGPSKPPPEGVPLWKRPLGHENAGLKTAGGVVLVSAEESVRALDPGSGERLWKRDDASATVSGDDVYLAENEGKRLRAVRASSGGTRWTYDFAFGEGPSRLAASDRVVCFAVSRAGRDGRAGAGALNRADGRRLWTSRLGDDPDAIAARGDLVVAASSDRLAALEAGTGRARWTRPMDHGDYLIIGRELVFACDRVGTLHALRAADGGVLWRRQNVAARSGRLGDGLLYMEGADAEILALEASTGRTAWSRRLARVENDPRSQATALRLSGAILYAACTDGTLYALNAADGRVRWTYAAETIRVSVPVSAAGRVFAVTEDGHVRALAPPETPGGSRGGS
ncbi:PQQ-binding-like beta-propeller repeat protein [Actinomadura geliboluensis]|uniref:protein kinase domain-containing protein n=1 Tax=Actinomadura geliboluensis TaxID=882440 RepID=UPI0037128098